MRLYAEITKLDREQRLVFGYASTEALDSQGEIVRKEAIEAALPSYMRFANIREMHLPSAVGVAKEAEIDARGLHLAARIVDEEAWRKVTEGVYKGFSIGGRVTSRDAAQKHVITGVELLEISLVDRPANPEAVIELYKRAPVLARAALLAKDLGAVQGLAALLAELERLCARAEDEAASEGDDTGIPAKLRAWLEDGTALLGAMVDEEGGEGDGATAEGAEDDAPEEDGDAAAEDAPPATEKRARIGAQKNGIATLERAMASLSRRLAKLEAEPLPPKVLAKAVAVGKEEDHGGAARGETVEGFLARLEGMSAEARAHELTKLALRLPRPLTR